jgi:hypothetical protein
VILWSNSDSFINQMQSNRFDLSSSPIYILLQTNFPDNYGANLNFIIKKNYKLQIVLILRFLNTLFLNQS